MLTGEDIVLVERAEAYAIERPGPDRMPEGFRYEKKEKLPLLVVVVSEVDSFMSMWKFE